MLLTRATDMKDFMSLISSQFNNSVSMSEIVFVELDECLYKANFYSRGGEKKVAVDFKCTHTHTHTCARTPARTCTRVRACKHTLHDMTWHYMILHYITKHYIKLQYITIHACIHTYIIPTFILKDYGKSQQNCSKYKQCCCRYSNQKSVVSPLS
jgi:hypothetical protein